MILVSFVIVLCFINAGTSADPFFPDMSKILESSNISTNYSYSNHACDVCICYKRKNPTGTYKLYVDCTYHDPPLTQFPIFPTDTSRLLLTGNAFEEIGYSNKFSQLPALRRIFLNNNKISRISPTAFVNTSGVNMLLLHFNFITNVSTDVFKHMPKLKYLWLNDNNISSVQNNAFHNMSRIESIFLQNNNLSTLSDGQFVGNTFG